MPGTVIPAKPISLKMSKSFALSDDDKDNIADNDYSKELKLINNLNLLTNSGRDKKSCDANIQKIEQVAAVIKKTFDPELYDKLQIYNEFLTSVYFEKCKKIYENVNAIILKRSFSKAEKISQLSSQLQKIQHLIEKNKRHILFTLQKNTSELFDGYASFKNDPHYLFENANILEDHIQEEINQCKIFRYGIEKSKLLECLELYDTSPNSEDLPVMVDSLLQDLLLTKTTASANDKYSEIVKETVELKSKILAQSSPAKYKGFSFPEGSSFYTTANFFSASNKGSILNHSPAVKLKK
jgi:hypothetical protein